MTHLTRLQLLLILTFSHLHAQTTEGYETHIHAGFILNTGNTENTRVDLGVDSKHIEENKEILLKAKYAYGQTTTTNDAGREVEKTDTDQASGSAQVNWLASDTFYYFYDLSAERDALAEVDYRVDTGPGIGVYLLRNDTTQLSLESSVVYVLEKTNGEESDYTAGKFGQRLDRKIGETAELWQSLEAVIRLEDPEETYIHAELGVSSTLIENVSLRIVLLNKYDNAPAEGVENNDLSLTAGISWRL